MGGVDVHDPWAGGATIINENPDSPFTRHLPAIWTLSNDGPYQPELYNRSDIQVLLRMDLSKLAPNAKYTRTDGSVVTGPSIRDYALAKAPDAS